MKNKVVVIGIDGATFDIILPMIKRGELPTFKSMMDGGTWGRLMSTYPPHTVPAWVSCVTGVNPGKLGLFDFRRDSHLTYDDGRVSLSTDIKVKPLWSLLSESDKKVMVVAMPMTYPPIKVNGIMVSPVKLIEPDKIRTYPPELSDELFKKLEITSVLKKRKAFMEMHTSRVSTGLESFLDTTVTSSRVIIEKLTDGVLYLFSKYEYDFAMFMLPIDALQHHLWCFMDKGHPSYNPKLASKYKDAVFEGYKGVDDALKRILSNLSEDTTVILVSDHGFGPLEKIFYLNRWLLEKGLLKLKGGAKHSFVFKKILLSRLLQRTGFGTIAKRLPVRLKDLGIPVIQKRMKPISELIDWQQTKAYATSYAININLKGREPQGVVDAGNGYKALVEYIKEELSKLKDPDTGEDVIEKVVEKEELYNGPHVDEAPDMCLFFKNPRYSVRKDPLYPRLFRQLTPDDRMTGHHTSFPLGICILKGPHIVNNGKLREPSIMDITPTVLYLMGEAVPEGLDGRILTEAINQECIQSHPIVTSKYSEGSGGRDVIGTEGLTAEDEEAIKKRLSELGYIG